MVGVVISLGGATECHATPHARRWFVWFAFQLSLLQQVTVVFFAKEWTEKMDSDTDGDDSSILVGNGDTDSPKTSNPDEETTKPDDYGSTMI